MISRSRLPAETAGVETASNEFGWDPHAQWICLCLLHRDVSDIAHLHGGIINDREGFFLPDAQYRRGNTVPGISAEPVTKMFHPWTIVDCYLVGTGIIVF
jgi:hypothetical protein